MSDFVSVISGVPQRSIRGPLLFMLFINDIYQWLDPETNIYADGTKIWRDRERETERDRDRERQREGER